MALSPSVKVRQALSAALLAVLMTTSCAGTALAACSAATPALINFGKVAVGSPFLNNVDFSWNGIPTGGTANVTSVVFGGAGEDLYTVDETKCATGDPNPPCSGAILTSTSSTCCFEVTLTPKHPGKLPAATKTVNVSQNNGQNPCVTNTLQGIGGIIVAPVNSTPTNPTLFALSTPTSSSPGAASITLTAANLQSTDTIAWSTKTTYTTSGGRKKISGPTPFSGPGPNQSTTQEFSGIGGLVTINATAEKYTDSVSAFIVGPPFTIFPLGSNAINPADITTGLTGLYGGITQICPNPGANNTPTAFAAATPALMTQIAMQESMYLQFFNNETLSFIAGGNQYNINNVWPHESNYIPSASKQKVGTGAHIGLMQVPTTMVDAWNWQQNATHAIVVPDSNVCQSVTDAVNSFQYKLGTASRVEATKANLPLTSCQLEEAALELYGPVRAIGTPYYIPKTVNGSQQWSINTSNNDAYCGVCYVTMVRNQVPPGGSNSSCSSTDPPTGMDCSAGTRKAKGCLF